MLRSMPIPAAACVHSPAPTQDAPTFSTRTQKPAALSQSSIQRGSTAGQHATTRHATMEHIIAGWIHRRAHQHGRTASHRYRTVASGVECALARAHVQRPARITRPPVLFPALIAVQVRNLNNPHRMFRLSRRFYDQASQPIQSRQPVPSPFSVCRSAGSIDLVSLRWLWGAFAFGRLGSSAHELLVRPRARTAQAAV